MTGQTKCAHMETRYDVNNDVTLMSRDGCMKRYLLHNFRPRKIPGLAEAPHDNRTWAQFIREHIQKYDPLILSTAGIKWFIYCKSFP